MPSCLEKTNIERDEVILLSKIFQSTELTAVTGHLLCDMNCTCTSHDCFTQSLQQSCMFWRWFVCVCLHKHVHVMCSCVLGANGGQRAMSGIIFNCSPRYVLRQGPSLSLELDNSWDPLAGKPQGCSSSPPHHAWLFNGCARNLHSGPTKLTKPSSPPSPLCWVF